MAPAVFSSQETMEPIMPGRAADAFPASFARRRPRLCRCFLTQSLSPPLSDGGAAGAEPPPPVRASTRVLMMNPRAVRMLASVTPCSRKRVRMRSASVVSSFRTQLIVSLIRLISERRASRLAAAASRREALSSLIEALSSFSLRRRSAILHPISSSTSPLSSASSSFCCSLVICLSTTDPSRRSP